MHTGLANQDNGLGLAVLDTLVDSLRLHIAVDDLARPVAHGANSPLFLGAPLTTRWQCWAVAGLVLRTYKMATGLTGEPVPPTTRSGLTVSKNS